jgi:hypothetical protein
VKFLLLGVCEFVLLGGGGVFGIFWNFVFSVVVVLIITHKL